VTAGLAQGPPIPTEVRDSVRARLEREMGWARMRSWACAIAAYDRKRLKPRTAHRIGLRALESGRGDRPGALPTGTAKAAGRLLKRPTVLAHACSSRRNADQLYAGSMRGSMRMGEAGDLDDGRRTRPAAARSRLLRARRQVAWPR